MVITNRRLMTVIALTAVLLAGARRVIEFQSRARFHQREAEKVQDLAFYLAFAPAPKGFQQPPPPDVVEREITRWHSFRAYHARLKIKYEHAAFRPWVPVEADDPPPDEPATLNATLRKVKSNSIGQHK